MAKVTFVYVGGDTVIDKKIEKFTGGMKDNISHVAVLLLNSTVEATGEKEEHDLYPGTWPHAYDKYFSNPNAKFIEVEVEDLAAGEAEARRLIGTPYGYGDCARTLAFEVFGIKVPDNQIGAHCSEVATRIAREMKLNILPDLEAGQVAPERHFNSMVNDFCGQDVTERYRAMAVTAA